MPEEIPATVPGCVHTDLLAAGLIPDPFLDANEDLVQWVADSDWTYSTTFAVPEEVRSHEHIDLVFEGLDTLATITLNGTEVATTANMHRTYRFDVAALLADGDNQLTVTLRVGNRSTATRCARAEGDWPSASFERPYNFLRKMALQLGMGLGPMADDGRHLAAGVVCRVGAPIAWCRSVRPPRSTATTTGRST